MHRFIILGGLLCMLSSGQRRGPAKLLDQEQMVSVLVDLALAKALVEHYTGDEDTARWLLAKNVAAVYQAHDIDLDTLQESYHYHLTHFETLDEIYRQVTERLEALSEQL